MTSVSRARASRWSTVCSKRRRRWELSRNKGLNVGQATEAAPVAVKRPYVSPQLKEYGSLADLTKGQLGRYPEGFNNSYKGPTF